MMMMILLVSLVSTSISLTNVVVVVVDGSRITSPSSSSSHHHPHHHHRHPHHHRRIAIRTASSVSSSVSSTTAAALRRTITIPRSSNHHHHPHYHSTSTTATTTSSNTADTPTKAAVVVVPSVPSVSQQNQKGTSSSSSSSSSQFYYYLPQQLPSPKQVFMVSLLSLISYYIYEYRTIWLPFFNKEMIQQKVISILQPLIPSDNSNNNKVPLLSLVYYTCGMSIWEFMGLSTIPVETAAGMIFPQYTIAVLCSLLGKIIGATLAFIIGRTYLQQSIQQHSMIQSNPIFQILLLSPYPSSSSLSSSWYYSFRTALCMKFSCFPELMKNFGSSCITTITIWNFILVTLLHGGFYTCIWTFLGYDTAQHVSNPTLATNPYVPILIGTAMITGCIITPLIMTWWIRDLQYQASLSKKNTQISRNTEIQQQWDRIKKHLQILSIRTHNEWNTLRMVLQYHWNTYRIQWQKVCTVIQLLQQHYRTQFQLFLQHLQQYRIEQQQIKRQRQQQQSLLSKPTKTQKSNTIFPTPSSRTIPSIARTTGTTAAATTTTTSLSKRSTIRPSSTKVLTNTETTTTTATTTGTTATNIPFLVRFFQNHSMAEIWIVLLLLLFLLSS